MTYRRKILQITPELLVDFLSLRVGDNISVNGVPNDLRIVGCEWRDDGYSPEGSRVILLLVESQSFDEVDEGALPKMSPLVYHRTTSGLAE